MESSSNSASSGNFSSEVESYGQSYSLNINSIRNKRLFSTLENFKMPGRRRGRLAKLKCSNGDSDEDVPVGNIGNFAVETGAEDKLTSILNSVSQLAHDIK